MKVLKYSMLLLMMAFVILSVYLSTLSGKYEVYRSRLIKAPSEVLFNDLVDFKNWKDWGPWHELDSTLVVTYAGQTSGIGGSYSWSSEFQGSGMIKTLKTDEFNKIEQEIIYQTAFGEMRSSVYWHIEEREKGSTITWTIKGEMPFFMRFMTPKMENQMSVMQVRGLELLDQHITRQMEIFQIESIGVVDYSGGYYLYSSTSCKIDDLRDQFNKMESELSTYIENYSIRTTGSPFMIYHTYDINNASAMISVAYPVAEKVSTEKSHILCALINRRQYFKLILTGSYRHLNNAWSTAYNEARQVQGFTVDDQGEPIEIYVNHPKTTFHPAELKTEIYIPMRKDD